MSSAHINRAQQTAEKISSFRELPTGWHYGNGNAPSDETIQKALTLNSELALSGFSKTNAFPGIEGEIQVTAYHGPLYLEFTIEPDRGITFIYEHNGEEIEQKEKLDLRTAVQIIRTFRGRTWVLSESFIKGTTTPIREISKVLPSSHPAMGAKSQSLMMSVYPKEELQFVNISGSSTRTSQAYQPSFGKSQLLLFLKVTGSCNKQAPQGILATTTL
jgi:hypothetical protein